MMELSDNFLFWIFVLVAVGLATMAVVFNERSIRKKNEQREKDLAASKQRLAEIMQSNWAHQHAVDALFTIHQITTAAIIEIERHK